MGSSHCVSGVCHGPTALQLKAKDKEGSDRVGDGKESSTVRAIPRPGARYGEAASDRVGRITAAARMSRRNSKQRSRRARGPSVTEPLTTTDTPPKYGQEHRDDGHRYEATPKSGRIGPGTTTKGSRMDTRTPTRNLAVAASQRQRVQAKL